MTTPTTGNPPAGWYADPSDAAMQRWYDGTGWTTHVQAVPTPAPAVPAPVVPTPVTPQYGYGATAAADPPLDPPEVLGRLLRGTCTQSRFLVALRDQKVQV